MNDALAKVTEWLLYASSQVGEQYFQLPVAGREDPEYRERVYCYELYHCWRSRWPEDFPFSLSGEIDKSGHPLIRNNPKPDFLVHMPGEMTNLLIVEVKPANAQVGRLLEDLEKLTSFRRDLAAPGDAGNYYAAYLWLYGLSVNDWPQFRRRMLLAAARNQAIDHSLVTCIIHEQPKAEAVQVEWQ